MIKKSIYLLLLITLVLLFPVWTLAGNPPSAVKMAMETRFPNARDIQWQKENAREYEASFVWRGEKYSANFNLKGEWLETESPLTLKQLPEKVRQAFLATHKGANLVAATKIETSKGTLKYELEFKWGTKVSEVFYNEEGKKLKK